MYRVIWGFLTSIKQLWLRIPKDLLFGFDMVFTHKAVSEFGIMSLMNPKKPIHWNSSNFQMPMPGGIVPGLSTRDGRENNGGLDSGVPWILQHRLFLNRGPKPGLVNIRKTMERSTIFNGKIHYFDWATASIAM